MDKVPALVYVLLPVHNRKSITMEFVETLKNQSFENYQLILIDDGSTDGTEAAVLNALPSTNVIRGDGNLWWAGSLQRGINFLESISAHPESIILMINDDTRIPKNFLETGVKLVMGSRKKIFCARSVSIQTGKLIDAGVYIDWFKYQFLPAKEQSTINCLSTQGLFLRFSDVRAIGGFRPELLPHYFSDYEFTVRANHRGYQLCSPGELTLEMNEETTGLHGADEMTLSEYFKKVFQIRSAINPWTGAKFITLAAPIHYKLFCYFRLFVYFSKCVVKAMRNGI